MTRQGLSVADPEERSTQAHLVELRDVHVRRSAFELHIPYWRVPSGAVIGVVGPNGAGKTTLLRLLPGLDPADSGEVRVVSHDPMIHPVEVRSQVGFMSDDMPIFALKIGALLRHLSGYYPTWDTRLVEHCLERFHLDPRKPVLELSKGEGTRIRLICALAFRPRLLVLDEPATGLDVGGRRTLIETVLDVVRDPQRSVIISSHQLGDVERIADRLLVLNNGGVVRDGATSDIVNEGQTLEEALIAWGAAG